MDAEFLEDVFDLFLWRARFDLAQGGELFGQAIELEFLQQKAGVAGGGVIEKGDDEAAVADGENERGLSCGAEERRELATVEPVGGVEAHEARRTAGADNNQAAVTLPALGL